MNNEWSNIGGCSWKHPFNKDKRTECEALYLEKREGGAKNIKAQADLTLAQAAYEKATKTDESGWSPLAVGGVIVGSLLAIGLMVVIIKRVGGK